MELPTIKYENCEELYTGQSPSPGVSNGVGYNVAAMKRGYNEVSVGVGDGITNANELFQASNCQMNVQMQGQYRNFYGPQPTHHQQQQMLNKVPEAAAPAKRYRRGESTVLFAPPFFELQQDYDAVISGSTITARCLSCHVILRGHKNVSSNFIKHMKRVHPDVYKIYENLKLLKYRGFSGPDSKANNANNSVTESDHAYFDASAFLEHMANAPAATAAPDEDHNSEETTDNSGTPPNSTEAIETAESSIESQQQQPRQAAVRLTMGENLFEKEYLQSHAKVDLSSKTLDLMSNMLDEKMKAFVTKTEFLETKQVLTNLVEKRDDKESGSGATATTTTPINKETAKIDTLQTQVDALKQECHELRSAMDQAQQSKRQLHRELQSIDRHVRQRRLVIRNIKVEDNDKPQEAVDKLFSDILQLPEISIDKTSILSQAKSQSNKQMLLIELKDATDAKRIFKNCSKLKNTGIFIEPDMCYYERKRKEKLLVLRRELLRRNGELKVFVRNTQLIVNGKHFYWDDVAGLCIDWSATQEMEPPSNAVECLKTLTNLDLKEFLNVLRNYDVQIR